ncbi:MAG TPA: condensation domain-containing protein, partial [Pyrinomonadaceae bacterium]
MSTHDLTTRRTQLSAAKRALLEKRLRGAAAPEAELTIPPRPERDRAPLSFAQQRLWFIDRLQPGGAAYNMPSALRLSGRLHVGALERSINEIVRRHESLRTTFQVFDQQPVQLIAPALFVPLAVRDLSDQPEAEREREAIRLATEEAQRPFDLARGPLVRAALLRLDETEHVLLFTLHHIISDGWSMGVLVRELVALYTAYAAEQESPLAALPVQYADFAVWQRGWLTGEVLDKQLAYWRKQLGDEPPTLELPTDHARPPVQSFRGATETLSFSPELTEALRHLSRRADATLFMTLLAAFQALLHRYTKQPDILVGTPIANRTRAELEPLIGFFVNTLVLRADCSGNPTFRELLARVRATTLDAYAHQDLPFERLVEELQPTRDLSRNPIMQVMFALQNAPMEALELPALTLSAQQFDLATTRFDLEFHLWDMPDGLRGVLIYSTDLFDAATIQRLLAHYHTLLTEIVADADRPLASYQILSPAERTQLLDEWNATQTNYPADCSMADLFSQQVTAQPDSVALVFADTALTYSELNERANQLAHHLQRHG